MPTQFSFIVPFHRDLAMLSRCLGALVPLPPESELIVAADGAVEDCRPLALQHGARVVIVDGPAGPAVARNRAAAIAAGDVLVFVDADVVVSRQALEHLVRIFHADPPTTAVIGAYDDRPAHPGFLSQYKNLSHAFVHRSSAGRSQTFWAGFGAVRRDAFHAIGGFDERFARPCVEDIDFGYRLIEAGYTVTLDPALTGCHLKRWTIGSIVASDIRDRGIPWTQLMRRYGVRGNHLNVSAAHRWSVVLAYLSLISVMLGSYDRRFAAGALLSWLAIILVNRDYYRFFYRVRGAWFAVRVWPVHVLHHVCNGLSFAAGTVLFLAARHLGLRLPFALPADSWSAQALSLERG